MRSSLLSLPMFGKFDWDNNHRDLQRSPACAPLHSSSFQTFQVGGWLWITSNISPQTWIRYKILIAASPFILHNLICSPSSRWSGPIAEFTKVKKRKVNSNTGSYSRVFVIYVIPTLYFTLLYPCKTLNLRTSLWHLTVDTSNYIENLQICSKISKSYGLDMYPDPIPES